MALMWSQAEIISAYTGVLMMPFDEFHRRLELKLERPIWTHELASDEMQKKIKAAYRDDFLALCPESPA